MSSQSKNVVLRAKSLKLVCSEDDAISIVAPYVQVTAYMLSLQKPMEVPDVCTIRDGILSAKTRLATLMANALGRIVNPENLSGVSIDVVAVGGYFKIHLYETTPLGQGVSGSYIQGFTVTLTNNTC